MTDIDTPLPRTTWDWLRIFGPGAIMASLTIGTGELIFSTRGGALFGYRVLFLFVAISVLKWALVVASSHHIVLTGVHPYGRLFQLPGPRGYLAWTLFFLAAVAIPIWVAFHSSVLGNLVAWVTQTRDGLAGGIDYVWGALILLGVLAWTATQGYTALERVQLFVVSAMVLCAGLSLVLLRPDWGALLAGAVLPQPLHYPAWLEEAYPKIAGQPVWVEATRYVGVIGGAAYDYMAYTSFLRDKRWGNAAAGPISPRELEVMAHDSDHPARRWTRAPLVDCSISFLLIIAFTACFVALGALVLGAERQLPDEANFLNHQARFLTRLHPWLLPLYVSGALLTMLGTLYGTLEVACALSSEMALSLHPEWASKQAKQIRRATIAWCSFGAIAILVWLAVHQITGGAGRPRVLLAILTPANLFTGVLGCGLFCLLNLWIDRRFLPKGLRMPIWLKAINGLAAATFVALGVKGYYDAPGGAYAAAALGGALLIGLAAAARYESRSQSTRSSRNR